MRDEERKEEEEEETREVRTSEKERTSKKCRHYPICKRVLRAAKMGVRKLWCSIIF